jgi:hypothetical protein
MKETIHRNVTQLTILHRLEEDESLQQGSQDKQSCILLVTRKNHLTNPTMDYAVNVADRMKCKVLASYVNTLPLIGDGGTHGRLFASAIEQNAAEFREKAAARGVEFEFVQESGKISKVISRLCHIVKRVEFVLIDQGINIEEAAFGSPVPVFNIVCTDSRTGKVIENRQVAKKLNGEKIMKAPSRKSYFKKTLIFGTVTAGLFAAVFSNSDLVMHYCTKGGVYAILPVAIVFAFSYVHGSFTSNFWSALGIEGSRGAAVKQTKVAEKRPDTRPRVQASV